MKSSDLHLTLLKSSLGEEEISIQAVNPPRETGIRVSVEETSMCTGDLCAY